MVRWAVRILGALAVAGLLLFLILPSRRTEPDRMRTQSIRDQMRRGQAVRFVALGDSITAGVGAPESFTRIAERLLREAYRNQGVQWFNAGVGGDTAEKGLVRLQRDVMDHEPQVVLVEFGWNEIRSGVSAERFEQSLRDIVSRIRQSTRAEVFLLTTTHVNVSLAHWKVRQRNRIIRNVAKELDTGLIDLFEEFSFARGNGAEITKLMSADRIHPSADGQQLIAEAVLRHFLPD